ncbi:MAG: response regulator, partial [Luteibacter sp.]
RAEGVDALTDTADLVDHVMDQFDTPDPRVPDVAALAAHIIAMRDEQPEATVAHILYEPDPEPLDEVPADATPADADASVETTPVDDEAPVEATPADEDASVEATPVDDDASVEATPVDDDASVGANPVDDDASVGANPVGDGAGDRLTFAPDLVPDEPTIAPEAPEAVAADTAEAGTGSRADLEAELEAMLAGELAALEAAGPTTPAVHAEPENTGPTFETPSEADIQAEIDAETDAAGTASASADDEIPGIELAPIEPIDSTDDLTAELLASFETFQIDKPEGPVEPIARYDVDEAAAWRTLVEGFDATHAAVVGSAAPTPVEEGAEALPQPMSHDGEVLHTEDGLVEPRVDEAASLDDEVIDETPSDEDTYVDANVDALAGDGSPTGLAPTEPAFEAVAEATDEPVADHVPDDVADDLADHVPDTEAPARDEAIEAEAFHLDGPVEPEAPAVDDVIDSAEPAFGEVMETAEPVADEDDKPVVIEDQSHEPVARPVHTPVDEPAPALVPELSPYADIDPDLLEVFVEEGREILDHADAALASWRVEPQMGEHVISLQRDLHTLKGSARMAGLAPVGDFAHAMEALLDAVANGQRDSDRASVEAMEVGFDRLHGMIQNIAHNRPIAIDEADIEPFARLAGAPIEPDTLTAEAYREEREAAEYIPATEPLPEPEVIPVLDRDLPDLLPEFEEEELQRASQEQIRVRADMLDTLVNHAGEVSIYRSRLEQQTASFRSTLTEHEQTVSRLRSQLRMLEIETETQIIARYHQEHRDNAAATFDPLELDRFSQLQQYSRALAESVSDLVSLQTILDELTRQSENLLLQQQRVNAELQEGLMQTRMLPFDAMVPNLRRTLRQAANDVGKRAQLVVEGANGEMDRNMLDRIKAPFEHMLRNAVAHGIESPEAREASGKHPEGTVRIQVAREATEVVVRLSDDGAGMDRDAIRAKAIERGLLRPDARVSDDQILQLTQVPGFSTAEKVTQVAGRGVGMDVVANEIKQLGGTLGIESEKGSGTTFTMRLPFTLAVTQALIVRIGETNFAIPMTSVNGVARVEPNELAHRMADEQPAFDYLGEEFAIHDLPQLLGVHIVASPDEGDIPLLLARSGDLRAAIRVDAVLGSREIVVKPVGPQVSSVPGILGATIMGDGSVLMILDLAPLVRHGVARRAFEAEAAVPHAPRAQDEVRVKPLVMVVDDSITMRKVTGRVLERHEFEVMTAKDGIDALEKLNERVPDLMLLDIEMPRMDGYELATQMKADERLAGVPIIMITSRTGDKHRQRAFDIGVERYIGKPYQENDLIVQINDVLGVHHG